MHMYVCMDEIKYDCQLLNSIVQCSNFRLQNIHFKLEENQDLTLPINTHIKPGTYKYF